MLKERTSTQGTKKGALKALELIHLGRNINEIWILKGLKVKKI